MKVKDLGVLLSCLMPLIKIDAAKSQYLIGTTKRELVVTSDRIRIKGAGGGEDVKDYVARYALSECLVIWRMMQEKHLSYREVVINLLTNK